MRFSKLKQLRRCFSSRAHAWFVDAMIHHRWARIAAHLWVIVRHRRDVKYHLNCIIREFHGRRHTS